MSLWFSRKYEFWPDLYVYVLMVLINKEWWFFELLVLVVKKVNFYSEFSSNFSILLWLPPMSL